MCWWGSVMKSLSTASAITKVGRFVLVLNSSSSSYSGTSFSSPSEMSIKVISFCLFHLGSQMEKAANSFPFNPMHSYSKWWKDSKLSLARISTSRTKSSTSS